MNEASVVRDKIMTRYIGCMLMKQHSVRPNTIQYNAHNALSKHNSQLSTNWSDFGAIVKLNS